MSTPMTRCAICQHIYESEYHDFCPECGNHSDLDEEVEDEEELEEPPINAGEES